MATRPSQYPMVLWPDESGGWLAAAPDLGCMSQGDTAAEAAANMEDAIACWIDAKHRLGLPVARPFLLPQRAAQILIDAAGRHEDDEPPPEAGAALAA